VFSIGALFGICSGASSTDGPESKSDTTPGWQTPASRDPQTSAAALPTDVPSVSIAPHPELNGLTICMHLTTNVLMRGCVTHSPCVIRVTSTLKVRGKPQFTPLTKLLTTIMFLFLIILFIYLFLKPISTATGKKTRLDIHNYGCNGNLLSDRGVVERNRIFSAVP